MDGIADLLESKLIHLSDQLELCVAGWSRYHQNDDIAEHLFYDVYELVGTLVEAIYQDFPEYNVDMARTEASNICHRIAEKLVMVIEMLVDQLKEHILPVLANGDEDTFVGAVALVGGDMAVRIDDVTYHPRTESLDSRTDVRPVTVSE